MMPLINILAGDNLGHFQHLGSGDYQHIVDFATDFTDNHVHRYKFGGPNQSELKIKIIIVKNKTTFDISEQIANYLDYDWIIIFCRANLVNPDTNTEFLDKIGEIPNLVYISADQHFRYDVVSYSDDKFKLKHISVKTDRNKLEQIMLTENQYRIETICKYKFDGYITLAISPDDFIVNFHQTNAQLDTISSIYSYNLSADLYNVCGKFDANYFGLYLKYKHKLLADKQLIEFR